MIMNEKFTLCDEVDAEGWQPSGSGQRPPNAVPILTISREQIQQARDAMPDSPYWDKVKAAADWLDSAGAAEGDVA
jgi:hypothetical protein